MPVNSTHPDYDSTLPAWLRARDVFAGEDAVKAAGVRYLPRLDSQSDDEYAAYKARASFFNASARTADGFLGLIFRREPTVKLPGDETDRTKGTNSIGAALKLFSEDVDLMGTSLYSHSKNVVAEVITVGRAGTLVDWGGSTPENKKDTGRAYTVSYTAEQILNWRMESVGGRNVVTLVALAETVELPGEKDDEFVPQTVEQIRVLKLVKSGGVPRPDGERQPHYVVEIWRPKPEGTNRGKRTSKKEWVLVETRTPLRLGRPLPQIPFVFHGARHSLPAVEKLPLADIMAVNLDHYRLNADYKHGLHFTALPTAWVSGFDKGAELRIGSSTAWVTETVGATAGFLEFKGSGLETFERAMDRDERLMAILGSRMLEAPKRVGETAEAIELRQSGENSVLMTLALSVSDSITQVLRWVYWWNSTETLPEDVGDHVVLLQLNTDFTARGLQSDELTSIVSAWQAGAISQATMFDLFRRGEVLPVGRTDEEERQAAAGDRPVAGANRGTSNMQHSTPIVERGGNGDADELGTNRTQAAS